MECLEQVKRELAENITGKPYEELSDEELESLELDDLAISWIELTNELMRRRI